MNSKEALEYLTSEMFTGGNSILKAEAEVCKNIILQDLERLEELEKAQNIEIDNLKFIESPNKYQTSIKVLKEAFIVLGRGDIANTCWFKYLEELEKENKHLEEYLKRRDEELRKELSIMAERERYFIEIINEYNNRESIAMKPIRLEVDSADLFKQNIELTNAIHKAIELLSVDGKGTKQEVKKLLSEVLENVD